MKKLWETWRLFLEEVSKEDEPLVKQSYKVEEEEYPISKWAEENGFTLRELDPNRLRSYLGSGAYGKAFAAVKNGKEYAVKIGGQSRNDEMTVISKLINIRDKLPKDIKKHVIKFYSPEELKFEDTISDNKKLYYVSVAELLQPLNSGDRKKLDASMYKDVENIEVVKNPFWSNREWGEVEENLLSKLEEDKLTKRLFVDALYEVRKLITKKEVSDLVLYAKEKGIKGNKKSSSSWDDIWTKMITDKLSQIEKGERLINHYTKKFNIEPSEALANIWNMVTKAGKLIFFANLPVDYSYGDEDTDPDILPAGELKSFNKAMKYLRDKYDILPSDIHAENIMRRENDWVIMDVGLFEV